MGRQHTTWISDETWERLQNIAGESVSKKIANAVKYADPDDQMIQKSNLRALARLKSGYRELAAIDLSRPEDLANSVYNILNELEHLIWEADMEMKERSDTLTFDQEMERVMIL